MKQRKNNNSIAARWGIFLSGLLVIPELCAQPGVNSLGLEEIVVTARRQAESLQVAPVAVSAVAGAFLDQMNVQDVSRVSEYIPNLVIAHQPSSTTSASISIRGIGQTEPAATAEQGVGLYLDGVYIARTSGAIFDLVDLERIEVLRGPQGTLFGRNTTGGAVQLVSKRPAETVALYQKFGYGRFNDWYSRTRIDTGSIAGLPIMATVSYLHRERDGYVDNILAPANKDPGSLNSNAVWVAITAELTDHARIFATFDWNQRRGTSSFFQLTGATTDATTYYERSPNYGGAPFLVSKAFQRKVQQDSFDGHYLSRAKNFGYNITLDVDISDAVAFKSISAYRRFNQGTIGVLTGNGVMRGEVLIDPDTYTTAIANLNGPFKQFHSPQPQTQYSEELQIYGGTDRWHYIGGLFYFYERAAEYNNQRMSMILPGGDLAMNFPAFQAFGGKTNSGAAFGQLSYKPATFDERVEITGGLRYTNDKKKFWSTAFPDLPGSKSFTNTSWLLSVSYAYTDEIMGFLRVSTGYKAGGFSPRSDIPSTFDSEKAVAYEAGLKAEWFDRRVRTNATIFRTDYDDLQVPLFRAGTGGLSSIVQNAGKAKLDGFELEITGLLTEHVRIDTSYGYVDPKYKEYLFRDPINDDVIDVAHQARFLNVAKRSFHLGLEYSTPVWDLGEVTARVDWSKRSERYFAPLDITAPFNRQVRDSGTENLHARIGLSGISLLSGEWEIAVWGDNLTNHDNVGYGIDFGGLGVGGVYFTEPRTYGLDVSLRF